MNRKKVAVYLSNLYEDMVRDTAEGVMESARRHDAKVLFFTSFTDNFSREQYARYQRYDAGNFPVFLLPKLEEYDGLISFDTYLPVSYLEPVDALKAKVSCPVITLGAVKPGTWSVVNDQERSMREIIEHVIVKHGCRDLAHVAGKIEMTFSRERVDIFRSTLADHGLPCGDDRIVYGDLTPDCGEPAVEELLLRWSGRERPVPEAIICANDYTAIGVIEALTRRGYDVPGDVIVTGYDDVLRAEYNEPSITTSAQPFTDVGRVGMDMLAALWRGETPDQVIAVPGIMKKRQSCGCEPFGVYKRDVVREQSLLTMKRMEALAQSNTNLILGAETDDTVEDIFDEIEDSCLRETGFRDAVLCLMDGWEQKRVIADREAMAQARFSVACGVWRGQSVPRGPLPAGRLLPDVMAEDPTPCFIFPVHHLEYFIGYFIVNPDLRNMGQLHIKSWLVSIGTVLENWSIRQQLISTVRELDHLHQTDMLTGLYNRRGYYRFFERFYQECRDSRMALAVFLIDMNHMKAVNDGYGHEEGDYCLKAIADAMRGAADGGEICARTGGDEFAVVAEDYDDAKAGTFVSRLRAALEEACERDHKPYRISVSVGLYMNTPPSEAQESVQHAAELFLSRADAAMYAEKRG